MKLRGITLETIYWEDYLSFLTEVLELELCELTEISMRLDLNGTWLEIKKVSVGASHVASNVEFALEEEDFRSMVQKINFYYYRKGANRFLLLNLTASVCEIIDPDGRVWRFQLEHALSHFPLTSVDSLRNF